jgi:hypothetical protein
LLVLELWWVTRPQAGHGGYYQDVPLLYHSVG